MNEDILFILSELSLYSFYLGKSSTLSESVTERGTLIRTAFEQIKSHLAEGA